MRRIVVGLGALALLAFLLWRTGALGPRSSGPEAAPGSEEAPEVANGEAPTDGAGDTERLARRTGARSAARRPAPIVGPKITGRVLDAAGKGVGGARVAAMPSTNTKTFTLADTDAVGFPGRIATADEVGRFEVGVAPSAPLHYVFATTQGYGIGVAHDVPADADVSIVLDPAVALVGRVRDRELKPVAGARVRVMCLVDAMTVVREARSTADGTYRVEDLPSPAGNGPATQPYFTPTYAEVTAEGFAPLFLDNALAGGKPPEIRLDLTLSRGSVVTGTVVDGESGTPIEGAKVALHSSEGMQGFGRQNGGHYSSPFGPRPLFSTLSATDGTFRFEHVPCVGPHPSASHNSSRNGGRALGGVSAWKPGFAAGAESLTLEKDGAQTQTTLRLWPAAAVFGRALEADGTPAADAAVGATVTGRVLEAWIPPFYEDAPRTWVRAGADGRFRIEGLPALRGGASEVTVRIARPTASRYVVSRREGDASRTISVKAGEAVDLGDVRLEPPEAIPTTTLVVTGPDGKPIWGASASRGFMSDAPRSDADGKLRWVWGPPRAGVPTPNVEVTVRAKGFAPATATLFPPGSGNETVTVALSKGQRLSGRVRQADGTPAVGVAVNVGNGSLPVAEVFPDPGQPWPIPYNEEDESSRGRIFGVAITGEDGTFSLEDLPDGPYHVSAAKVKRVRSGDAKPLRVVASAVPAGTSDLSLVLPVDDSPPTGRVEGRLVDAKTGGPVANATVGLQRGKETLAAAFGDPRMSLPGVGGARIESDGRFAFEDVPVGPCTLSAGAAGYLTATVAALDVGAGATTTVPPIRLGVGASIVGRLTGPPATEWKERQVSVQPVDPAPDRSAAEGPVSHDGTYRVTGLTPGAYRLVATTFFGLGDPARPPLIPPATAVIVIPGADAEVRFDAALIAAGSLSLQPNDDRLPPPPFSPTKPTEEQTAFGAATRVTVRGPDGAILCDQKGIARMFVSSGGFLTLPPGRYVARLELPGGEVREETVDLAAGALAEVRFTKK